MTLWISNIPFRILPFPFDLPPHLSPRKIIGCLTCFLPPYPSSESLRPSTDFTTRSLHLKRAWKQLMRRLKHSLRQRKRHSRH